MTQDDIIRMAREAGLVIDGNNSGDDDLFAFAAVVSARAAALEREACFNEADWNLIAAAPDLLDSCKALLAITDFVNLHGPATGDARAAIAKAEGEQA